MGLTYEERKELKRRVSAALQARIEELKQAGLWMDDARIDEAFRRIPQTMPLARKR